MIIDPKKFKRFEIFKTDFRGTKKQIKSKLNQKLQWFIFEKTKIKAVFCISIILISTLVWFLDIEFGFSIKNFATVEDHYDVNEEVEFHWSLSGKFNRSVILFGDGNFREMDYPKTSTKHSYNLQGKYHAILYVWNNKGELLSERTSVKIKNDPPLFDITVPSKIHEGEKIEVKIRNLHDSKIDLEQNKFSIIYNFADGTEVTTENRSVTHIWDNAGKYPLTVSIIDDQGALRQKKELIEVVNKNPIAYFSHKLVHTEKGYYFQFDGSLSNDTLNDLSSLKYLWDFGNGKYGYGKIVKHSFSKKGDYNVLLTVIDDNGAKDIYNKTIKVEHESSMVASDYKSEKDLEIVGPLSFSTNTEGHAYALDVEIARGFSTQQKVKYNWYNHKNRIFSHNPKPIVNLNDGTYPFTLKVEDNLGRSVSEKVNLTFHNQIPEVVVSDYTFHGSKQDAKSRSIEIIAYGFDSFHDLTKLKYFWTITERNDTWKFNSPGNSFGILNFKCKKSGIYHGNVEVRDPSGGRGVCNFKIYSVIDDDADGYSNQIEEIYAKTHETIYNYTDKDKDFLSDNYELLFSSTNSLNPDSDEDGLFDGYDASGVGELSLATNPQNPDSDDDNLTDGIEYYGWNISIKGFQGSETLTHVMSDPLNNDTDNDGLLDFEEYLLGSNPGSADTDFDGLDDKEDPAPLAYDSDGDYLSDYEEYEIGTFFNNSDSDDDGLNDGEEMFGWGLKGFQTDPRDPDCDNDFLADSAEMKLYTIGLEDQYKNRIRKKISEPISLYFPYVFETAASANIKIAISFGEYAQENNKEYGVADNEVSNLIVKIKHEENDVCLFQAKTEKTRYFAQTIDVSDIMNNESSRYNYHGHYQLELQGDTTYCILEKFELEFCRYLDPNDPDFDKDGIKDGIEMNLLAKGKEIFDLRDFYNETECILNTESTINSSNAEFLLDISQIGKIDNAELFLGVNSDSLLRKDLKMEIELRKTELKSSLKRLSLYQDEMIYDSNEQVNFELALPLKEFMFEKKMKEYGGTYLLKIKVEQNASKPDQLLLSRFEIIADMYRDAGIKDIHAWITDPALNDTDEDGLNDYDEIYINGTNPQNHDTDGDGAVDGLDRDPKRNVVLKVSPISAAFRNMYYPWGSPYLQIIINAKINDLIDPKGANKENNICIPIIPKQATTEPTWWGSKKKAWWNEGSETHYYIDINDDISIQSDTVNFTFQLWEVINKSNDVDIFEGKWLSNLYDIGNVGDLKRLSVVYIGDFGNKNTVTVDVSTIGIERVNTVAIYDPEETMFNGHYQSVERMNVFQLYVKDSDESTPFVQGANAVIIPTSLFERTQLNSYIERERIDETPLFSPDGELFQFYSIDREGNMVNATEDVDFVFVRFDLTASEALEILNMLIRIVKDWNQTDKENPDTVVAYEYKSTKQEGYAATLLNIPKGTMNFIPWEFSYENSEFGELPNKLNEIQTFLCLWVYLISFPFIVMTVFFGFFLRDVKNENEEISNESGLDSFPRIGSILWVFIRSSLITFSYICLALEVLTTSALFTALGLTLETITKLSDIICEWKVNLAIPYGKNTKTAYIKLQIKESIINVETWINWTYWAYFDMYFPLPKLYFDIDMPINEPSGKPQEPSLHCGFEKVEDNTSLKYNFFTTYKDANGEPPRYVFLKLMAPNRTLLTYEMSPTRDRTEFDMIHIKGLEYNKTIDFTEKKSGLWFYAFVTEENSSLNFQTKYPLEYAYELGPYIDSEEEAKKPLQYFLYSDYDYDIRYVNQRLSFSVTGADFMDNLIPEDVYVNILLTDGRITQCPMELSSEYIMEGEENTTDDDVSLRKYSRLFRFFNYSHIKEPTTLRYYFSAKFKGGQEAFLFGTSECLEEDEQGTIPKKTWFEGPTLIPTNINGNHKPYIIGWKVEEVLSGKTYSSDSLSKTLIGPVRDEEVLRFWVYVADPDGTHEEHYENGTEIVPYTVLEMTDLPRNQTQRLNVTLPMVWAGRHWDPYPNMDAYFIDLHPNGRLTFNHENFTECDFRPGVWSVKFAVKDGNSEEQTVKNAEINNREIKIWSIGSANEMWNVAFNGYFVNEDLLKTILPAMGILHSIGMSISYGVAAVTSMCPNTKGVGHLMAVGIAKYDLINSFVGLFKLFLSGRTGAILGVGINSLLTLAGLKMAYLLGTIRTKLMSIENIGNYLNHLRIVSNIGSFLFLFNLIIMLTFDPTKILEIFVPSSIGFPEEVEELDPEYPGEEMIEKVSSDIISFILSILGLGAILNLAAIKEVPFSQEISKEFLDRNIADPIIKTLRYHILIKGVVSILSFFIFFYETGMPYLIGDVYHLLQT